MRPAQRYDDLDMNGDTSNTSMNINNGFILQLLLVQRLRPAKRRTRSWSSHVSRETRRDASDRDAMRLRISPKVRTLRQSRLSSVASIHRVTVGSGLAFTSSEMTLVSSRNPLTGQPSDRSLASVPDRLAPLPEAIPQRTWRGFEAALHVP